MNGYRSRTMFRGEDVREIELHLGCNEFKMPPPRKVIVHRQSVNQEYGVSATGTHLFYTN